MKGDFVSDKLENNVYNNKTNSNIKLDLYTLNDFSKFKLYDDLSFDGNIILNNPEIFLREDRIIILNNKKIIKQVFEDFLQRIFVIIPIENQKLLLNNIDNLIIKSNNNCFDLIYNIFFYLKTNEHENGYYDIRNNEINVKTKIEYYIYNILLKNKKRINYKKFIEKVLPHELLHMASSFCQNDTCYSGFSQFKKNDDIIGTFITEGYTELLLLKIYPDKKYSSRSYAYERVVAEAIEQIVGYDTMSNLYFNANLFGLINELSKYNSIENVKDFIKKLDRLEYLIHFNNLNEVLKEFLDLDNKINCFLIDSYIKKLKFDNTKNDEIIEKTITYSKKLISKIFIWSKFRYSIDVERYLEENFYEYNLLSNIKIKK